MGSGTEIAKAYVQIIPSARAIKGKIAEALSGEAESAGRSIGRSLGDEVDSNLSAVINAASPGMFDSLGSCLKKALTVTAAITAAKKAADAVYKVGSAAVSAYADYEQLVGGVETLFKGSAKTVQNYADNAYKTAGISANNYMKTATSFAASLIQSLGGDTKEAAKMANVAITDMADNANKMGTDMQAIQDAYQGFAKQNYTMLDNLKLGYGGTKSEMERLLEDAEALKAKQGEVADYSIDSYADIVEAIHVVQTEMGITGTTSLEAAETISGSFSSAKASAENLLVAMVATDQDIIEKGQETADALVTAFGNVGPAIANFMTVGIRAIEDAVDPANKVSRALGEVEEAQERVVSANNILDLVARYKSLREQTQNAKLSSSELAGIEEEMVSVRNQLATATGNAKIAQSDSNDEVEQAVEYEQALAEIEKERANVKLYEKISKGAASYREAMDELKRTTGELAEAEDHYENVSENRTKNQAEEYERLTEKMNALWDGLDDGTLTTEELHSGLDQIARDVYDLTGNKVEFKDILAGQDYIDNLDLSFGNLGNEIITSYEEMDSLRSRSDELTDSTEAFRADLKQLVDAGLVPVDEAAGYLGVTVDQVDDILNAAETATDGLTDAMTEDDTAAQELNQSLAKIGTEAYSVIGSGEDLRAKYEELTSQLDSMDGELDQTTLDMVNTALKTLDLAATNQELTDSYPGFVEAAGNAGVALSNLSGWLIDNGITAEEWGGKVDTATDGVINSFDKVDTNLDLSLSEIANNLQYNIDAYSSWNSNIQTLMQAAVNSGNQAAVDFVNYLQGMGVGAATQVQAMVDDIGYTMDTFPPLMEQAAQEGMGSVFNEVTGEKSNISGAAADVMSGATDAIQTANLGGAASAAASEMPAAIIAETPAVTEASEQLGMAAHTAIADINWKLLGTAIGTGITNGINSSQGTISKAGQNLADAVINIWTGRSGAFQSAGSSAGAKIRSGLGAQNNAIRSTAQQLATSVTSLWVSYAGNFQQSGTLAGTRIRTGLSGQNGAIQDAARNLAAAVLQAWQSNMGNFQSAGLGASNALTSGLYSGQGNVSGAASSVIGAAYSAMQVGGWYDLGYNISAGVANGVRGGSYLITQAANAAAQRALASAKSSLGIHSPSRVFRDEVGKMITAGISAGMTATDALHSLDAASDAVTDAISIDTGSSYAASQIKRDIYVETMDRTVGGELGDGLTALEEKLDRLIGLLAEMAGISITINGADYKSKMELAEAIIAMIDRKRARREAAYG